MSDNEPSAISTCSRRARRAVSGLTFQQVQHKRDLDRKAQRALRQRNKLRMQDLENDIARVKASCSEREQAMIDEIQLLRDQNRQLRSCLESIGQFASDGVNLGEAKDTAVVTDDKVAPEATEQTGTQSPHGGVSTPEAAAAPDEGGLTLPSATALAGGNAEQGPTHDTASGASVDFLPLPISNTALSQSNFVAGRPVGSDSSLNLPSGTHPADRINGARVPRSDHLPHPAFPSASFKSMSWVLPKHTAATCPLDQILLDFIASRRSMIARGVQLETVIGPESPSMGAVLNREAAPSADAISLMLAEVLGTFAHVQLPEKAAFMYLMHRTTRWQISPDDASYVSLPHWLRPTAMQITVPHAAWIDNIPWSRVRDMLIENPDRYPFAVFSSFYSEHVSINWPHEPEDVVSHHGDRTVLNSIFEKHIQRLSNWTVSRQFQEYFSEMTSAIYIGT